MIFSSRKKAGPDPHLQWKVRLFFLGAALALLGVARDSNLLVLGAIGVLLIAVGLRFLGRGQEEPEAEEGD